jgi:hypothetical protein
MESDEADLNQPARAAARRNSPPNEHTSDTESRTKVDSGSVIEAQFTVRQGTVGHSLTLSSGVS